MQHDHARPRRNMRLFFATFLFAMGGFCSASVEAATPQDSSSESLAARTADVIVYGGTSAAVTAAVQVKRMGKSVLIVCPDKHLGGLSSGGLGWTDTGNKAVIGGLARDFYHRVWKHYDQTDAWRWQSKDAYGGKGQGTAAIDGANRTMWIFEPHVAEQVFEDLIAEHEIPVFRDQWLDRESGVSLVDGRIAEIRMLGGQTYVGQMFLDTTYEGDLVASAGVSYHVGRESTKTYGEEYNGVQTGVLHHAHHFGVLQRRVDPYVVKGDPQSGVIPRVSADPPGVYGDSDNRIQAYCFRMCLTDHDANRVPFAKPSGYDPGQYELMLRTFDAGWTNVFNKFDPIPNHKTDTNNHGPMSTDNIGFNYDYPEGSYDRRREIIQEHETYQKGWLYFIANDPRVPESIRNRMQSWGLAADEFTDNGNWPHQLYIREARRMIGPVVMNENHLLKRIETPDSIGMGSYKMDSHNVQRYITPDGYVQNEGDIGVSTHGPYQIAYGSVVPKKDECENLLVPVCISSSHIAFGSIRMEPVFMILGQSAATAAVMAIDTGTAVQDVRYSDLKQKLVADGQVLETPADAYIPRTAGVQITSLPGITIDDERAKREGRWTHSTSSKLYAGGGYSHDGKGVNGPCAATFSTTLPAAGVYQVRIGYTPNSNRASNVPVTIRHADGQASIIVNQKQTPSEDGLFIIGGTFRFRADQPASVTVSNTDADGYVVIDAVSWVPVGE